MTLASSPQVWTYFAVLVWSMLRSLRGARRWPGVVVCALAVVSATWFYICRYTVEYTGEGGTNIFDAAYIDVLKAPHWGTSSQLLVWVVVAVVWSHDAPLHYVVFGMLGAMSAAFALWLPTRSAAAESPRRIPSAFIATSLGALYAIERIAPDAGGGFAPNFSAWLKALHVLLLAPLLAVRVWPAQPRVEGTLVYAALFAWSAARHWAQLRAAYAAPQSDCQLSITIDLACCSAITLVAVGRRFNSASAAAVAALLLPLVSPAGVLALYLFAAHAGAAHGELVARAQRCGAARKRAVAGGAGRRGADATDPEWCNLGLWRGDAEGESPGYDAACAQLARALGAHAALSSDDTVLACGCGRGAELHLYKREFGVRHVTGAERDAAAARAFAPTHNVRLVTAPAETLGERFAQRGAFSAVLALDTVYHFDRAHFFATCAEKLLLRGGRVAVTDVLLAEGSSAPLWLRLALRACGVRGVVRAAEYVARLEALGFGDVDVVYYTADVLPHWMPRWVSEHLEYAAVVATRVDSDAAPAARAEARKRRVAVVGSGLAGLAAAHALTSSSRGADVDVTIFEAAPKVRRRSSRRARARRSLSPCAPPPRRAVHSVRRLLTAARAHAPPSFPADFFRGFALLPPRQAGLSGNAYVVDGAVVDVPLRMVGRGYYDTVDGLCAALGVPTVPARSDCCFSGEPPPASGSGRAPFALFAERSLRRNACTALRHARAGARFDAALYANDEVEGECFGRWLERHGYALGDGCVDAASDAPMWALAGQLSWVLSCSYDQVQGSPAAIILGFCRGLGLGLRAMMRPRRGIVRVDPSIDALQLALAHGSTLRCATAVSGVEIDAGGSAARGGGDGVEVAGERFDALIVATEASAVRKVLRGAAPVFDEVAYQPSSIVLHCDASLMPQRRADWRALNVAQKPGAGAGMSQLTVWLNAYYPECEFGRDTFETWNCLHAPREESVIKTAHFKRVVHTVETPRLLREIEAEQGVGRVWYAGSYACTGMGLLEQAAVSGRRAAAGVLEELFLDVRV